jgi:DNA-binding phage protein
MSIGKCCPYSDEKENCKFEIYYGQPRFEKCPTCERFLKKQLPDIDTPKYKIDERGNVIRDKKMSENVAKDKDLKLVKEGKIDLTQHEYFSATVKPDNKYHSVHEGYAFLLEKIEDVKQQFEMLYSTGLPILWESTKTEDFDCAMLQLKAMLGNIQSLIKEAAQAGMVVQKIYNTIDDTVPGDIQ